MFLPLYLLTFLPLPVFIGLFHYSERERERERGKEGNATGGVRRNILLRLQVPSEITKLGIDQRFYYSYGDKGILTRRVCVG